MTTDSVPTPSRRVSPRIVVALFAAIFAALAIGYYLFVQPAYVDAFTGVRPADTAALVAQLDAKAIPYRLADGGSTVAVPVTKADAAQVAIASSDVPLHGGVGLELFNKSDMGLTDFAQKINYQRALQGELERTITMIDGITAARVHLAIPERSIFRAERVPPKAAVELLTKPGTVLDASRIVGVQRLVANAVADLVSTDVVIIDSTGRALTGASDAEPSADPVGEQQQALQRLYRARARAALAATLPNTRFDVRVLILPRLPVGAATGADDAGVTHDGPRDFGLRLTVMSDAPLPPDQEALARAACERAVELNASLGDAITFAVGIPDVRAPSTLTPAVAATSASVPSAIQPQKDMSLPGWIWLLIMGGAAALVAAAVKWRGARRASLAARQRADLVERLHVALAEGEAGYAR